MDKDKSVKKKKIEHERRQFSAEWTNKYFFIERNSKYICLICRDTIAFPKEYNLKHHYETKHQANSVNHTEGERKLKAEELQRKLSLEQNVFTKLSSTEEAATKASFQMSEEIAVSERPFR
jgi:hypothetical protein